MKRNESICHMRNGKNFGIPFETLAETGLVDDRDVFGDARVQRHRVESGQREPAEVRPDRRGRALLRLQDDRAPRGPARQGSRQVTSDSCLFSIFASVLRNASHFALLPRKKFCTSYDA